MKKKAGRTAPTLSNLSGDPKRLVKMCAGLIAPERFGQPWPRLAEGARISEM
jgi:hypothetical protein